eukprot:6657055-Pyramimonas_sp.AAC.1
MSDCECTVAGLTEEHDVTKVSGSSCALSYVDNFEGPDIALRGSIPCASGSRGCASTRRRNLSCSTVGMADPMSL